MIASTGAESDRSDQARAFQPTLGLLALLRPLTAAFGATAAGHFGTTILSRFNYYNEIVSKRFSGGAAGETADRRLGGILHTGIRRCLYTGSPTNLTL